MDEETGLPVVSIDSEMLEGNITTLVVKDDEFGSILCHDCECKGPVTLAFSSSSRATSRTGAARTSA